ncbi:MAG: hypothetical protein KJ950_06100 [Proteobacteria bacterium]|nr:hypothetical protein [Pseudomonadota bacterium]MBU1688757.1 hypothetical protein [Pseudomonadota bacterium]
MKRTTATFVMILLGFLVSGCAARFIDQACHSRVAERPLDLSVPSWVFDVDLRKKCNPSGINLEADKKYRFEVQQISLNVFDGTIKCRRPDYRSEGKDCCLPIGADGFRVEELKLGFLERFIMKVAENFRPVATCDGNWLELVATIGESERFFRLDPLVRNQVEFSPAEGGELFVLANDYPWLDRYCNNAGEYQVKVILIGE